MHGIEWVYHPAAILCTATFSGCPCLAWSVQGQSLVYNIWEAIVLAECAFHGHGRLRQKVDMLEHAVTAIAARVDMKFAIDLKHACGKGSTVRCVPLHSLPGGCPLLVPA